MLRMWAETLVEPAWVTASGRVTPLCVASALSRPELRKTKLSLLWWNRESPVRPTCAILRLPTWTALSAVSLTADM